MKIHFSSGHINRNKLMRGLLTAHKTPSDLAGPLGFRYFFFLTTIPLKVFTENSSFFVFVF